MERKHPLALCEECPFGDQGGFVPTLNPQPKSKIAVIGEAPGAYEAAYGIPFTGPSGDLLNQVLRHHGLPRDEIMITNSVLCRPRGNEDPPKKALESCAPRLHAEIAEGGVTRIVAVGKAAAHALVDSRAAMRRLRVGPPKPYKINSSVAVIPTWHPAYSLRSPDSFPDLVFDFGKVKGGPSSDWSEPYYRVFDDPDTVQRALFELRSRFDRVVIDIECGIEKDSAYVHPDQFDLLCVGLSFAPGRAMVLGENALKDRGVQHALRETLSSIKLIAHNGKFDLAGLRSVCGKQELWFDTMLAAYSLDERPGHMGLKHLSIERLGAPDYESAIRQYIPRSGNYADIPRPVLYRYNAFDVVCTWGLYELFSAEMSDDDRRKHDFLVRASNTIIELELAGIEFDIVYNAELTESFLKEINSIEEEIHEIVGYELNPRSPKQITQYFEEKGYILQTTNADLLTELKEKFNGELLHFTEALLHHRKKAKLFGTYVKGLAKRVHKGKVYTTYLLHGSTSGRLASREPNLQNIPRAPKEANVANIRNQFVVEHPDNLFIQADYKQAEGRVIATLARDEYLRAIFSDNSRDLFNELCNDIFGIGKWNKENRVAMKSIFYGNAYGRGAQSITKELNLQGLTISLNETVELMRNFNALIPNVIMWQNAVKELVLNGEDLTTPYGRRRSFWLITDRNRTDVLNEALSFLPQSIASDICLNGLINLYPLLANLATVRLTIHDAIVVECRRQNVQEVVDIMRREMLASALGFTDYVPFEVDVSMGYRWGEL